MRISDRSSDVCSSDLEISTGAFTTRNFNFITGDPANTCTPSATCVPWDPIYLTEEGRQQLLAGAGAGGARELHLVNNDLKVPYSDQFSLGVRGRFGLWRSEEHTSELQTLMRISYAVFCLKKKSTPKQHNNHTTIYRIKH